MSRSQTARIQDNHRETYEELTPQYESVTHLHRAEIVLLRLFRGDWAKMDMLDIGVGGGRTSFTFSAIAKRYVGVDYSINMIEACKRQIPESIRVKFEVADARNLSAFYKQKFDLVQFSYNGIDYVDIADREKIFAEVKKVLKPSGTFFFSSHNFEIFPFRFEKPAFQKNLIRWALNWARTTAFHARLWLANRTVQFEQLKERGWAVLQDGTHEFRLMTYYTTAKFQVVQLEKMGFRVDQILDSDGNPVKNFSAPNSPWLNYQCSLKKTR